MVITLARPTPSARPGRTSHRAPHLAAPLLAAAALIAATTPALADKTDDDAKRAEALFNEAREAMQRKEYATACPKFEESLKLVRRAGTLFNLAQCEEHEGRLVTAIQYYKEGIVVLDPGDPRLAPSKKRLIALEPRLPYLRVVPQADLPKGSRVAMDGREVAELSVEIAVNPGKHTITVSAPKHADKSFDVEIAEREHRDAPISAGDPLPDEPPPDVVAASLGPRRIGAFVALGVGALGFIAAGVTGGLVISANDRVNEGCPQARCATSTGYEAAQTGKTLLVANTIAWGVGVAGAAAGTVLLLVGPKKVASSEAANSLVISPNFVGVRGSF